MAEIITYTTPSIPIRVKDVDLTGCTVKVTMMQKRKNDSIVAAVTADADSVTYDSPDTLVVVTYTQEQTGEFEGGEAKIMVNALDDNDNREASYSGTIDVIENLLPEVMTNDE